MYHYIYLKKTSLVPPGDPQYIERCVCVEGVEGGRRWEQVDVLTRNSYAFPTSTSKCHQMLCCNLSWRTPCISHRVHRRYNTDKWWHLLPTVKTWGMGLKISSQSKSLGHWMKYKILRCYCIIFGKTTSLTEPPSEEECKRPPLRLFSVKR